MENNIVGKSIHIELITYPTESDDNDDDDDDDSSSLLLVDIARKIEYEIKLLN